MNDKQRNTIALLHRVQEFCVAYPPPVPTRAYAAKVESLNVVVHKLESQVAQQQAADGIARNGTRVRRALLDVLRTDHMLPIHRIANTLTELVPEVVQMFRMPSGNTDQTAFLGGARAMVKAARPLASTFISHGRPDDFVEQMEAVIAMIDRASEHRVAGLRQRAGATVSIDLVVQEARSVLTYLDLIIRAAFAGDGQVLHEWKRAQRVQARSLPGQTGTGTPVVEPGPDDPVSPA